MTINTRRSLVIAIATTLAMVALMGGPANGWGGFGGKSKDGDAEIEAAITALRDGGPANASQARDALEILVAKYPKSELADDALLEVGRSLLAEERYVDASAKFDELLNKYPQGDARHEARYLLGVSLLKSGKPDEASVALSRIGPRDPHYVEASLVMIKALLEQGKSSEALDRYGRVRNLVKNENKVKDLDAQVRDAVATMSEADLEKLAENGAGTMVGEMALYYLGEKSYAKGRFKRARDVFTKFLAQYGDSRMSPEVRQVLEEIDKVEAVDKYAIGLVVPLTGKWAVFGRRFLYGAALALGAFSPDPDARFPFKLHVVDSKSDPETARKAVEELCVEKKVIAIIGPVQGDESAAAAREAQACGVPIITMTQVEETTKIGNMVFRNFATPRDQARMMVWYGVTAMGIKSFAILYPDHQYGQLYKKVFAEEAVKMDAQVALAIPYKPGQTDFKEEIKKLAARKREYQALFVPDSYYTAGTLAPQLKLYNVVRIQLMGSSGWNSPKLIEYVQPQTSTIEGAVFPDSFFAQSPEPYVRDFLHDFRATFGYEPEVYEATAFETAKIVASVISEKRITDRLKMRDALATLVNFASFSGNVEAKEDRSFRRPLFVLQVKQGEIVDISTTSHF